MRRWSLVLLFLLMLAGQALATPQPGEFSGGPDSDNYRWLLDSPSWQYLSSAAQRYLNLAYGPRAQSGENEDESQDGEELSALDQIINDRSQDEQPSLTEQNETTIEISGSNLVAGWNDDGQYLSTLSLTGYGYSTDGGRTWHDGGVIPALPGGSNIGDPDVKADRAGSFYFSTLAIRPDGASIVAVSKSTDGGKTFGIPVEASVGASNLADFQDKEFMIVDNSGGPHDGTIYVTWTDFSASGGDQIMISRSTNSGRSFSKAMPVSPVGNFQASIPRVGPQGELYVLYLDYDASGLRLSKSTDGGKSFGADGLDNSLIARVSYIGTLNLNCGRQIMKGNIRTWEMPSIAISSANGDVYVVYASNPTGPDQSDIYLISSSDGGVTWSQPVRVNDDRTQNDQFFSFVAAAPDGTIGISFYDRRNDPSNLKIDKYLAVSRDRGRTFEPNIRMSSVSSPIPPVETYDNCYMADYDQIVADSEYFYATWGDNRNQALTWRTGATMPRPRQQAAAAGVGDAVLVIGGYYTDLPTVSDTGTNEAYLPASDSWVTLAPDPIQRADAAAVGYGLFAYVAGGRSLPSGDLLARFDRYDALNNTWMQLTSMPTPRAGFGMTILGSTIYAIGGRDCSLYVACGQALNVNEAYNIKTGRWETKAPLPTARMDFAAVAVKDKIYVLGGYNSDEGGFLTSVEIYDPTTDTWSQGTDLPAPRISGAAGACGDKIVFFGGYTPAYSPSSRVRVYDTVNKKWQYGPFLKVPRAELQGARAGDQLFAIGGSYAANPRYAGYNEAFPCKTMGAFRPDPDVFFAKIPVQPPLCCPQPDTLTSVAEPAPKLQAITEEFPTQGSITFVVQGQGISSIYVQLFDLSGRRVAQESTQGKRLTLHVAPRQANGVYLYVVTVRGRDGSEVSSKVEKFVLLR